MAAIDVPSSRDVDELEVARELVRQAREAGVGLTGPGGLLKAMTKTVIETALDEELSEHLDMTATIGLGMAVATRATEPARNGAH
ncbi:putative fusion of transposase for IS2606 and sialic acid-transport integral membrane protein NanT [Mycobacterium ulcerans str. Harvey]|uniref:Fusion of transposase for IS2606 and sialic acid-transport integral membrane protein NanT n=1 Tax=Mycobacterium ulcerans str. Harvey TaxID=1299332 RepID=A0ABN0QUH9_MYCUL|nr:putative fusion of transposase for IS2606 and sialic acid-transport integral membrane protein NanT [Mycobacterium ulcerans str. Harvey]